VAYHLTYHPEVKSRDLPKIDSRSRSMIKRAIEERPTEGPEVFARPLRHTLKGYWKLRVGNYRVVFRVIDDTIRIHAILHRKDVYAVADRRAV